MAYVQITKVQIRELEVSRTALDAPTESIPDGMVLISVSLRPELANVVSGLNLTTRHLLL